MEQWEREVRVEALAPHHYLAMWFLSLDHVEPDDPFGRLVRRWAQRTKWLLIDGVDPDLYELWLACQRAVDRAFHPEVELEAKGFVVPTRQIVRARAV